MNNTFSTILQARKGLIWIFIILAFTVVGLVRDLVVYLQCH